MRPSKHLGVLALLLLAMALLAGCGAPTTALDSAGHGDAPAAVHTRAVEAAQAANQIMLGEGISARGHRLYFKGVPLSVREKELAQCLPDKELLYLMQRYKAYGDKQALHDALDLSVDENEPEAIIATNRLLQKEVRDKVRAEWRAHPTPWQRLRGVERSDDDFQAYLEKCRDKNKTHLYLLR